MIAFDVSIMILLGHFLVAGQPRNFKYSSQGITKLAVFGSKLTIECPLAGPFYQWRIYQSKYESRMLLDQDLQKIVFDPATMDKSGIYECKSTTGFGNAVTNITVKVVDLDNEITKEICSFMKREVSFEIERGLCFYNNVYEKKVVYKLGVNAELDCRAVGRNLRYSWYFIDQNGLQTRISPTYNITSVTILNIISENEGSYKCEVINDQGLKISRLFSLAISDIQLESGIEVIGDKFMSYLLKYDENVNMVCEIKKNYQSIHSIKWGKRITDPIIESRPSGNIVFWDNYNYRMLSTNGISENHNDPNQITSTLTITKADESSSGIYICLAMNTFGSTVYKLFNVTVYTESIADNSGKRSQFFFLYILSPAILIFICICSIIYCCVKTSSAKHSNNSVPLKQCNSSNPSNGNKTLTSNYYYPVSTSRSNTTCPPLPQLTESPASLLTSNIIPPYSTYGNYHYAPSNPQSCCTINGV